MSHPRLHRPRALRNIFHCINCGIYMFFGIERSDREPHTTVNRLNAKLTMHKRCAMKTCARCNVVIDVQHDPDITCFETINIHSQRCEMIFKLLATVSDDAVDSPKTIHETFAEAHLVAIYFLDASPPLNPILRRP